MELSTFFLVIEAYTTTPKTNCDIFQIRLYQVLDMEDMTSLEGLRLLSQRRVSAHDRGWEVFPVKDTVTEWANGTSPNHGGFECGINL